VSHIFRNYASELISSGRKNLTPTPQRLNNLFHTTWPVICFNPVNVLNYLAAPVISKLVPRSSILNFCHCAGVFCQCRRSWTTESPPSNTLKRPVKNSYTCLHYIPTLSSTLTVLRILLCPLTYHLIQLALEVSPFFYATVAFMPLFTVYVTYRLFFLRPHRLD
jgi:hypothetical protein